MFPKENTTFDSWNYRGVIQECYTCHELANKVQENTCLFPVEKHLILLKIFQKAYRNKSATGLPRQAVINVIKLLDITLKTHFWFKYFKTYIIFKFLIR